MSEQTASPGHTNGNRAVKATIHNRLLGSLKDALLAAGREDAGAAAAEAVRQPGAVKPTAKASSATPQAMKVAIDDHAPAAEHGGYGTPRAEAQPSAVEHSAAQSPDTAASPQPSRRLTAEEAARLARRTLPPAGVPANVSAELPPTTRVLRSDSKAKSDPVATTDPLEATPQTVLVRGNKPIARSTFAADPVVGFLIVVGGPGLGAFCPVFEGNNTIGRATSNRVAINFGDESISSEAQAYIRYDSSDRSFLFVPNLAKTNIVSVNDKRPATAVELNAMDVITIGRTQVAFVPFCGDEFDWSEISEA